MSLLSETPNCFRYGNACNRPWTSESSHTSWLPTAGKTRPGRPAARIWSSGAGSCFNTSSYTRLQYGFSEGVGPCLPHQTMSPVLSMNLALPLWTSFTTSRPTHSPPCNRNIVRRTPGSSFTSSTDASVTQPLSTVNVLTSLLVSNGMTIWISSLVAGSYVSLTSFLTTSSATLSGSTSSNISTISLIASSL